MLNKCANSSCSASFRHLSDGRLFRLETDRTSRSPKHRATEYFWLCAQCSGRMTLLLAQDGNVTTTGLRAMRLNGFPVASDSIDREKGLLLRSISFLRKGAVRAVATNENAIQEHAISRGGPADEIVAAASNCPAADCGSLVLEYRAADSVRLGHAGDWEFKCSRCGMEFRVNKGELIFQSIPKRWLSATLRVA